MGKQTGVDWDENGKAHFIVIDIDGALASLNVLEEESNKIDEAIQEFHMKASLLPEMVFINKQPKLLVMVDVEVLNDDLTFEWEICEFCQYQPEFRERSICIKKEKFVQEDSKACEQFKEFPDLESYVKRTEKNV